MSAKLLNDPFNPSSGEFAKNIRAITGLDDDELRKSLKAFGWREEFPAIADENGVVLVGHRRMRLAKQLDIEPVIKTITLGNGDDADAERLKIAIVSNIGGQPMTREDRKRIAEHLYGKKEWTMEAIAKALNVDKATVSRDLSNSCTVQQSKPAKTASNPKGAGRPKGSGGKRKSKPRQTDNQESTIIALADGGMTSTKIAAQLGVEGRAVRHVLEREATRRKAIEEAEPEIDVKTLSMSAQEKVASAIRQHQRKLDHEFERRVIDEVKRRIDEIILPHWKKQIAEAKTLYARRKGLMDKDTFNIIRRGLHPDSRNSISDKKLGEAFDTFMGLEKFLLNEKDSPTDFGAIPNTLAEWDAMRARARKQPKRANEVQRS